MSISHNPAKVSERKGFLRIILPCSAFQVSTNCIEIMDATNEPIACIMNDLLHSTPSDKAKAFFVAKTLNCHADLVEALEAMVKAFKEVLPGIKNIACKDYAIVNDAPVLAQKALAKAKAKKSCGAP